MAKYDVQGVNTLVFSRRDLPRGYVVWIPGHVRLNIGHVRCLRSLMNFRCAAAEQVCELEQCDSDDSSGSFD